MTESAEGVRQTGVKSRIKIAICARDKVEFAMSYLCSLLAKARFS